jgi:sugar phosphate isomerase/epimerase
MKLNLSCTDFSFPLLAHDRTLALIALLGFRGVDIGLFEGHGHLKPSRELTKPARNGAALKRKLAAHGLRAADIFLQIHSDFAEFAVNHPDAKRRKFARERFLRTLDYANAAESKHITILPGVVFENESRAASVFRSTDELAWRVSQSQVAKLQLAVEPHVGSLMGTPERALDLVKRVPGLGFTLDYAHFTRAGISDTRIEPLTKFATHLHARAARDGRLQSSLKKNTIDFSRMLAALNKNKFAGWMALEYVWIDWEHCNEVDVISETISLRDQLVCAAEKMNL